MEQLGEMIMSSIARAAGVASDWNPLGSLLGLWQQLSASLYRFLEELPERCEDVDSEVFKRVTLPI